MVKNKPKLKAKTPIISRKSFSPIKNLIGQYNLKIDNMVKEKLNKHLQMNETKIKSLQDYIDLTYKIKNVEKDWDKLR